MNLNDAIHLINSRSGFFRVERNGDHCLVRCIQGEDTTEKKTNSEIVAWGRQFDERFHCKTSKQWKKSVHSKNRRAERMKIKQEKFDSLPPSAPLIKGDIWDID